MKRFPFFEEILKARFLGRPNRFLVRCKRKGQVLSAFLPNPGRLQELLLPGCTIHLIKEIEHDGRKTLYTVVGVEKKGHSIMLHTHRTNEVARHLIQMGKIPGLEMARIVKSEVKVGNNRFDYLLQEGTRQILLEVKSCTLVGKRVAMFPDAVTERGTRHLRELAQWSEEGRGAAVLFLVHWPFVDMFMPDYHTDLHFSRTLLKVKDKIQIIPVAVKWNKNLSLSRKVKVLRIPWDYLETEVVDKGSYLIILRLKRDRKIDIGGLGGILFRKGFYVYVGSAMSNLSKRMERHKRLRKRYHWHIDYLRASAELHSIMAIRSSEKLECEIARAMAKASEWAIPRFGSSDCACDTHLFGMREDPLHFRPFHEMLQYFRMDRSVETILHTVADKKHPSCIVTGERGCRSK